MLLKNFRASVLAIAVVASVPSAFLRFGIFLLTFVCEFTYDQNILGEFFAFCIILSLNWILKVFVVDHSSFLILMYLVRSYSHLDFLYRIHNLFFRSFFRIASSGILQNSIYSAIKSPCNFHVQFTLLSLALIKLISCKVISRAFLICDFSVAILIKIQTSVVAVPESGIMYKIVNHILFIRKHKIKEPWFVSVSVSCWFENMLV